ncbi:transcriptional regulator GcvA [Amphritea sp. 1_MG-2023]|uniref:transcriptional regulator GcvA n=1 Tax=Amphritea sp. 1_MG-2023 TaxID=3062670 RepID=UPI0026E12997|nr:transcriptional regulator GcvA [Amphritea sp. 1_MG-2023]MDO6563678.1 transcriptional regulator GcvA [Amphritea sp. 1_MG-2023]
MLLRLPPLEALRYFEVSARHLSFTQAAEELCLSQSAVSQKIIQLEELLGYRLFERKPRQLILTTKGEQLFYSVQQSLLQIRDTLNTIETQALMSRLQVYCMPSFASRWLMPCLNDFHLQYPNIDLHLVANLSEPNFHSEEVDIGICHGARDQPIMEQRLLFRDYIYPVASPELAAQLAMKTPQELNKAVLLHDSLPHAKLSTSWQRWLAEQNIKGVDYSNGYRFNQADLIVQAAINGQGVALGRHALVAREIAQGRLVPLFDTITEDDGVYLVCLKKLLERPKIANFFAWMEQQARLFEQQYNAEQLIASKRYNVNS